VWSLLCVYQALSRLITYAAAHHQLDPDRISFTRARNIARRSVNWTGGSFSPSTPCRHAQARLPGTPPSQPQTPRP
jgi:hypothetical protein